jgi:predicted ATPase
VPPHASYLFKHALVQDAAYGTLLRGPRRTLHAHIVETLEGQFLEIAESRPELLAHHCTEAGRINEAIDYWTKAGQMSVTRSAIVEATRQVRKGLALLSDLVESPERQRKELVLQTMLGWATFLSKGEADPEVQEAFVRARALCDDLGDRSSLGPLLYLQGCHLIATAQYAAALLIAEDQLNLAAERNDSVLELQARQNIGRCLHWLGALGSAIEHFEHALGVSVPETSDQFLKPVESSRVVASTYLAFDLLLCGYVDRAVACRDRALALARRTSRPYSLAIALTYAALGDLLRGVQPAAVECLTELANLARQQDFPSFEAVADLGLARIQCARGKSAEGVARARRAIAAYPTSGAAAGRTGQLAALAYCCERAGEVGESLELLDVALEIANTTDERCYEAELHRLKGQYLLAYRPARGAEAESSYQCALAVARRQEAKFWELRAATSLARLWRDKGKRAEARELLAPIYGWFTEGFDTPVLQDAKALLDELA